MLRKYATLDILDARMGDPNVRLRTAHRAVFEYIPREGYLYVRSRAISSRCNDNFDYFSAGDIKGNGSTTGYKTFIGKPVFVNHNNEDHRRARGVIIDAALHEDRNSDGSPDTWAEVLMEVDAVRFPILVKAILAGHIDRTSMGVDVEHSTCSVCANVAERPDQYCRHIPAMKGKRYQSIDYRTGAKKNNLVYEKCAGLRFFENSLLVEEPADPTAATLDRPVLGPGLDHLAKIAVHRADELIMRKAKPADMSDEDLVDTDEELKRRARMLGKPGQVSSIHQTVQTERKRRVGAVDPRQFDVPEDAFPGLPRATAAGVCPACRGTDTLRIQATRECCECGHLWTVAVVDPERLFVQAKPKFESPADHPFFKVNPVSSQNIVDHWNQATPDEKNSGRRWYPDAHLVAKALGTLHPGHPVNNPGTPAAEKYASDSQEHEKVDTQHTHMAAGMLANYSPQTGWETNQHNAARAIHEGKGIGGKGSGVFASDQQRKNADRMLAGESHTDVLGGPKISDFAHLIEHGGDKDESEPHVVIDRHALSVATGKRMSTEDYGDFPKTQRHYYGHVVQAYKDAADQIGQKTGEKLHGHQVQAATWLVRQRLNQEGEKASQGQNAGADSLSKGRQNARGNAATGWGNFKKEHLPHLDANPGTGYVARKVAYGEQKAPADVDTLRDESCPICFTPDTLVRTVDGYVPIASVEEGDFVLSRGGVFRKVAKVMSRPYDGALYEITTRSCPEPIMTTPNHPFMSLHGSHPSTSWDGNPCKPGTCGKYGDSFMGTRWKNQEIKHWLDWTEAKNLTVGSYLATSTPSHGHDVESIDVPTQFCGRGVQRRGPRSFRLTDDFLWMIGLYLAEGSASPRHITFSLHQKEIEYINRIENLFSSLGYSTAVKTLNGSRGVNVEIYSTILAQWFPAWLGSGSHNKHIPAELINSSVGRLGMVIEGVLDGDDCKSRESFKQTSPVLALQVGEYFIRLGSPLSMYSEYSEGRKRAYIVNHSTIKSARIKTTPRNWVVGERLLSEVRHIRTVPYSGDVYNLMVEGDPSYTVQNILVHNCGESSNAYDGRNCMVCGWEAPPKMFADPDLEMAKQVDLRKDVLDPTGTDPDGTGVGDFADESAGGLEVGEDQPDLVCTNCGTKFEAGQPQTTNTDDPEAGDRGEGPAEGDPCPNCGVGELVPPDVLDSDQDEENPQGSLNGGTDDVDVQGGNAPPVDPSGFEQEPDVEDDEDEPDQGSSAPFEKDDDGSEDDEDDDSDDDSPFPPKKDKGRAKTK